MSRTIVGIVTFGGLEFTKLAIRGIQENTTCPVDIFVVVGKPGDDATNGWLQSQGINGVVHDKNYGFPASINDLYDRAWKNHDYDNLVIMGNDVIPYPGSIDALIEVADTTDNEWMCSSQYDVRNLHDQYPEVRHLFEGPKLVFKRFDERPWEVHKDFRPPGIKEASLSDVRNLTLFKRSVFEKMGYSDVNFWPGGYYEDNDACRRANLLYIKACEVQHSAFFHFWSRTIHQEGGSTTPAFFENNRNFYRAKWGGDFGSEKWDKPFGGAIHTLRKGVHLKPDLKIADRAQEQDIINHWKP